MWIRCASTSTCTCGWFCKRYVCSQMNFFRQHDKEWVVSLNKSSHAWTSSRTLYYYCISKSKVINYVCLWWSTLIFKIDYSLNLFSQKSISRCFYLLRPFNKTSLTNHQYDSEHLPKFGPHSALYYLKYIVVIS